MTGIYELGCSKENCQPLHWFVDHDLREKNNLSRTVRVERGPPYVKFQSS